MIPWQNIFSASPGAKLIGDEAVVARNLPDLKQFLDAVHIRQCLVKPYQENRAYPVVEARELLPSFDNDMYEYKDLPGFAMVAFGRQLESFSEIFQYDKLYKVATDEAGQSCPLESQVLEQNAQLMASRLPKSMQEGARALLRDKDATLLEHYPALLPWLLEMDRAQVLALDGNGLFQLAGIYASFPSDIDNELKRFGIRMGKFVYGDSEMYERNRMFVYQYLMELYGFPIVSERRTSSALFARKLHRMGEKFMLRVLGQTDRTLTTYLSLGENRQYPRVEKIALVRVEREQQEAVEAIGSRGFFLDPEKRVVIMRVAYRQHRYDPSNLRQDRALSVAFQEVLHPLTGEALGGLNIIKDANNMLLRLNDIVRGEYVGRIVYKRAEVIENTETDEKRLKFLYSWLVKHQRRMISQTDEFYAKVNNVISVYLYNPEKKDIFESLNSLRQEVVSSLSYIHQARRVRLLQDIAARKFYGERLGYRQMSSEAVGLLKELKFEIVNFFPDLVDAIIKSVEIILHDRYLRRTYIESSEHSLTASGMEIRKNYGKLVGLLDSIKEVRKARLAMRRKAEERVA